MTSAQRGRNTELRMSDVEKALAEATQNVVQKFDFEGNLSVDCAELLSHIDDQILNIATAYWDYWAGMHKFDELENPNIRTAMVVRTAEFIRGRLRNATGTEWRNGLQAQVIDACKRGITLTDVLAASACTSIQYHQALGAVIDRNSDDFLRLSKAIVRFSNADLAIMAACYTHYQTNRALEKQVDFTAQFDNDIAASEVATASEQSAVAMREAAQTAAGLIRAIEDTRSEVELAAEVANRATDRAQEAVEATDTLSDQSKSIESILGLIRDIAGQTNLLALNATIEAARAGDAGRGFAVVAQEVKSLANQTAKATDEIAEKIAAIQSATKASVESNISIRATVQDVHHSAERIRRAMEEQAQTVTMITASVDETALAADLMSNTISAIRTDTENVVSEISLLEQGFADVESKISALQANAGRFVSNLMR
jgi:methyl-accepting chemotaxis protein